MSELAKELQNDSNWWRWEIKVVDEDSELNQRLGMLVEKGECVCRIYDAKVFFIILNFFVKMIFTTKIKNNGGGGFLVG